MLGNLGENLTKTMKKLVGISVIDKKTIEEVVKEIQRALIQSDVNIALVLDLSKKIKKRALEGTSKRYYSKRACYNNYLRRNGKSVRW